MKKITALSLSALLVLLPIGNAAAAKYPSAPTDFTNLFQNRKGISHAAWLRISQRAANAPAATVNLEVITGPNSKPYYSTTSKAINKVASIFAKGMVPSKVYVIQYKYKDLKWATEKMKSLVSDNDYTNMNRNEGGHLVDSNCNVNTKSCVGSKALLSSVPEGFILQGVPESVPPSANEVMRYKTGQLEAHEFFHLMQKLPLFGKNLTETDWPPQWVSEGSSEWVQNATMNSASYDNYLKFIKADSQSMYVNPLMKKDGAYLTSYLALSNYKTHWNNFDGWIAYTAGSRFTEMLVAMYGVDSILDFYTQLSAGIGFEAAFKATFNTEWSVAQPVMAKTLAANLRDQS